MIVDGHMQCLYDEKGRRYLDVSTGVFLFFVRLCSLSPRSPTNRTKASEE